MASKVLIWMPVRNEAAHLEEAILSVLAQTFENFALVISDNHSTDDSWGIIKKYAELDPRIIAMKPEKFLAGIPHMKLLWAALSRGQDYTIHIGGHDKWPPRHLETLVARADGCHPSEPFALIYTDTWIIDDAGVLVGHYKDVMQTGQIGKPAIPQYVIAGVSSPQFFGLWNEAVRSKLAIRHACSGFDHLVVVEVALHGAILFEGNTSLLLRAISVHDSLERYGQRHLDPEILAAGPQDFLNQLEWLVHCVDTSIDEIPEESRPMYRSLLTASMFCTYMSLRGMNLHVVPGAMEIFNALPEVRQAFGAVAAIDANVRKLLRLPSQIPSIEIDPPA